VTQNHAPSIELNALLIGKNKTAAAKALVDSGATGNLINRKFAAKHQMTPHVLKMPIPLLNADNSESLVKSCINVTMRLTDQEGQVHQETIKMYTANIGQQDIILGTGWLIKHNPEIDWENYELKFSRCPSTCKLEEPLQLKNKPTTSGTKARTIRTRRIKNTLPKEFWSEDDDSEKQMGG
jgi:hypothetical protein